MAQCLATRRGFTLLGPDNNAALGVGAKGVAVTGNIASRGFNGFSIFGSDNIITGNVAVANRAVGFTIQGPGHTVRGNASIANGDGFAVVLTTDVRLTDNVSTGNIFGSLFLGCPTWSTTPSDRQHQRRNPR